MNDISTKFIGPRDGGPIEDVISSEGGGGGSGAITHPFQITEVAGEASPTILVRYGTMQDVIPTSVNANFTTLTNNATNVIYLAVTVDINGVFASCEMVSDASKPADSDYIGYITLGTVVIASGAITTINQACTHSLRMAMCGRVVDGASLTARGTYEFWGF